MNVESEEIGPTTSDPEIALLPLQPPDAVHELVFELDQVSVEEPFTETAPGLAVSVTDGAVGEAATVMLVDLVVIPPLPEHDKVYVPLLVRFVNP